MNNGTKTKYINFLRTLAIPEGYEWIAVDNAENRTNKVHCYGGKVNWHNDYGEWGDNYNSSACECVPLQTLPKELQPNFPYEDSLIHISELEETKGEPTNLKKIDIEVKSFKHLNSLLVEGKIIGIRCYDNVQDMYIRLYDDGYYFLSDSDWIKLDVNIHVELDCGNGIGIYEDSPWYDKLNNGMILCWTTETKQFPVFIRDYSPMKDVPPFVGVDDIRYKNPIPLTKDEVLKFIA